MYTNYVFQNLEMQEISIYRYVTVTKCPNWQFSNKIKIGDIGFLEYEYAEAGEEYFDRTSNSKKQYSYTSNYFMNFIKETRDEQKEYNF